MFSIGYFPVGYFPSGYFPTGGTEAAESYYGFTYIFGPAGLFYRAPEWDPSPVEVLRWATDIIISRDGSEQRIQLRAEPRREIQFNLFMITIPNCLAVFADIINNQTGTWKVPLWWDAVMCTNSITPGTNRVINCDTTTREFVVGGKAIIWADDDVAEEVFISFKTDNSITAPIVSRNWAANKYYIAPLIVAGMQSDIDFQQPNSALGIVEFRFKTP